MLSQTGMTSSQAHLIVGCVVCMLLSPSIYLDSPEADCEKKMYREVGRKVERQGRKTKKRKGVVIIC